MIVEPGLIKVAKAILDLKYTEMIEMADLLIQSIKADAEEGDQFDVTSKPEWCERLRWWAEGYIDAQENDQ